ncbi:MAG: molybdopterin-synthase adenylyltransferase MoeB [Saprospiraceae bacterium]|nr:molybdopterin-synthase adenylyltransferase MoeB [Saprospiraceae bacterium]
MNDDPLHSLTKDELLRYSRHILIPDFGLEGQKKLKKSRALVIGAGGLGSPVLLYLAAAGVGLIGIVDGDVVEETNLQRQILFSSMQIGNFKAEKAAERLRSLNPHIEIKTHQVWLNAENALAIFSDYDLIIDGSDNFPTRYLVNDACVLLNKPLVYGSIFQFEGQVSVFNYLTPQGDRGPNYRDLFPEPPSPGLIPSCSEGGVLGVLPGIIGSMQANEAIKILAGIGSTLSGRLFIFDALNFHSVTLHISKNPSLPPITRLIDYQAFCGYPKETISNQQEISPIQLAQLMISNSNFQLIDVREPYEYAIVDLGGIKLPEKEIDNHIDQISKDQKVVIYCRSGKRSADVISRLQTAYPFTNLFNLTGGVLAYIDQVDSSLSRY